mmetsp:Transcript_99866/g.265420  ORF Transcript_99866/g.265420 Transcript_99866/m.265420 type:complete len:231 (-) Transcript_99866:141-833(-)
MVASAKDGVEAGEAAANARGAHLRKEPQRLGPESANLAGHDGCGVRHDIGLELRRSHPAEQGVRPHGLPAPSAGADRGAVCDNVGREAPARQRLQEPQCLLPLASSLARADEPIEGHDVWLHCGDDDRECPLPLASTRQRVEHYDVRLDPSLAHARQRPKGTLPGTASDGTCGAGVGYHVWLHLSRTHGCKKCSRPVPGCTAATPIEGLQQSIASQHVRSQLLVLQDLQQ